MKAYSVELEAEVHLSDEEIKKLKESFLEGELNFRGVGSDEDTRRNIPFRLSYDKSQKESLEVEITPKKTYFGEADKIIYTINEYLYDRLIETDSCGDRFWNSGRLLIFKERH